MSRHSTKIFNRKYLISFLLCAYSTVCLICSEHSSLHFHNFTISTEKSLLWLWTDFIEFLSLSFVWTICCLLWNLQNFFPFWNSIVLRAEMFKLIVSSSDYANEKRQNQQQNAFKVLVTLHHRWCIDSKLHKVWKMTLIRGKAKDSE